MTPELVVGMTISDLDYLKVHQLYVLDRSARSRGGQGRPAPPLVVRDAALRSRPPTPLPATPSCR